ncbi:pyrroline-5-carboxylate reductase family protein [Archaeoglobus veneficus]|uniref:Pyrroline-5-carboxylate reductase n=1 Tax=Archaeoglobus veneficus (strain DSM 11195 / SNP6) TaxID=693661 RepID=F2KN12_ARCVS|nr:pyrroline-5-carboxylate reductase [Archaeoglobus veneficus]AEA47288.1 Pyrroline-5-carboxylate reductase [Archaeoglobus veneficus SNP6]
MRVAIIGCGNLGCALAKALAKRFDVIVTRRNTEKIRFLEEIRCEITSDNIEAVVGSDIVMLTVKKKDVVGVLSQIGKHLSGKVLISFVAGLGFDELKRLAPNAKIVKAMTTLSAEFGKGITTYYTDVESETQDIVRDIEKVLSCFGDVVRVGSEYEVDVTTAFSSSTAFLARIFQAFVYAGLRLGLSAELSRRIAIGVFDGTSEMLKFEKPEELILRVTTPAGTTIEGLHRLMEHRAEYAVMEAICASAEKSLRK